MMSMQGASMNDFWLRSWSLSGIENVSVLLKNRFAFNRKALRLFFSSRELFFSSIWTVWTSLRSVRQLSDLGKEKFSLRKETSPSSFSISEQPLSSSTEHIFSLLWSMSKFRALRKNSCIFSFTMERVQIQGSVKTQAFSLYYGACPNSWLLAKNPSFSLY